MKIKYLFTATNVRVKDSWLKKVKTAENITLFFQYRILTRMLLDLCVLETAIVLLKIRYFSRIPFKKYIILIN